MLDQKKLELEVKKLALEVERLSEERHSIYVRYGEILRLVLGFALTGILGTYVGLILQRRAEQEKLRLADRERFVQKCEDTLKLAENVLARRQYLELRMISILQKRASGDLLTDRDTEEDLFQNYMKAVEDWNIGLNMNRTIVKKVFGDGIGSMFYGGGEGIQWENMSITLRFVTIHGSILVRWRKYRNGEKFSLDNLLKNHHDLSDQVSLFYDHCLERILSEEKR